VLAAMVQQKVKHSRHARVGGLCGSHYGKKVTTDGRCVDVIVQGWCDGILEQERKLCLPRWCSKKSETCPQAGNLRLLCNDFFFSLSLSLSLSLGECLLRVAPAHPMSLLLALLARPHVRVRGVPTVRERGLHPLTRCCCCCFACLSSCPCACGADCARARVAPTHPLLLLLLCLPVLMSVCVRRSSARVRAACRRCARHCTRT
jgi:hypothetical protein